MANRFLPLEGVRVVEVTSSPAEPYCTEIPGALGADAADGVIRRIESSA